MTMSNSNNTLHKHLRLCAGALLVGLAATLVTGAGDAAPPPGPTPPPAPAPAPVPVYWTVSKAYEGPMKDMDVAASPSLTGAVPVLGAFQLSYDRFSAIAVPRDRHDHMVRRLGVLANSRFATFSMSDQNGDDSFWGKATWALMSAGKMGKVHASGGGQFEIQLPTERVVGHKLVLTGFMFERKVGTDANLRSIGVWLNPVRNSVRVMLMDDQGPDFRGFEQTIGLILLAGAVPIPMGQEIGPALAMSDAVRRVNAGEKAGKYRPYAVTVQYAWIPDSIVKSSDTVTGTGSTPSSGKIMSGATVLQGFEMFFTNSDHHLNAIGIVSPHWQSVIANVDPQTSLGTENVIYQDQNHDDPKRWAVSYVALKPSGS